MGQVKRVHEAMAAVGWDAILLSASSSVQWISDFTGSFGYALITTDDALFITDSRYAIQAEQQIWAQLFLLERQISSPEAYQKHYQLMIYVWDQALNCYTHNPAQNLSLNIHRISYGFISQSLLVNPDFQHWDQLAQEIIHLMQKRCY